MSESKKRNGFICNEYEYDGMVLPDMFPSDDLERIRNMEYRADDTMIVTYPKCGEYNTTIWYGEISNIMRSFCLPLCGQENTLSQPCRVRRRRGFPIQGSTTGLSKAVACHTMSMQRYMGHKRTSHLSYRRVGHCDPVEYFILIS